MIRLGAPVLGDEELQAVKAVLATGQLVQAGEVAAFESELGGYLGKQAIAVSSGTAALHLALLTLGVGSNDLVVVPALSWPATANVVEAVGAQSVFVDVDPKSFDIDKAALERVLDRLCSTPGTRHRFKAVIVVHSFGAIGDMTATSELCRSAGVPLIEDAACAIGSRRGNRQPGSWGDLGCFSFHPRKLLTTGEGGAVTCGDSESEARLRALRNHGLGTQDSGRPAFVLPGLNYRMSEIHAAIGRRQLARLDGLVETRQRQAALYRSLLAPLGVKAQSVDSECVHNVQSFVARLPVRTAKDRDRIVAAMKEHDIETTIGTWHIPLTGYFASRYGYRQGDFPGTDQAFANSLTLPLGHEMTETDQRAVAAALGECLIEAA